MSEDFKLIDKVASYNPNCDKDLLKKAIEFARSAHSSQIRASGEPYFIHPLAVANILADLTLDDASIITGLLHDTLEDTMVTEHTIEKEYGIEVAKLVLGVTKLNKIEYQPENVRQAENFRKLLLAMSEDIRILLVKICDRLHNMRTISHIKSKFKRVKIAQETLEIYAPLTERIGIHKIKDELQDLSFQEINSEVRESIIQRLEFLRTQGDSNIIEKIVGDLRALLIQKSLDCKIYGRTKKPYSIWKKMKTKNVSFEQLSDIMAFRVVVDRVDECYNTLGTVHEVYPSIPGSFKDYISTPKENGYQSLHTTVIGPEKQKIEIQIRTKKMHQIAEYGIAAHWSYKQNIADHSSSDKQYRWINELLHILENSSDPEEFIQNTRLEMYQDQVFCFSPKGDLIALPQGSTAVDFAYAVHSDIGNSCMGAKINGIIAPLRTILKNGDQVEVICSNNQNPSELWDEFVVTGKARSQIRKFIRSKRKVRYLEMGKNSLNKFFHARNSILNEEMILNILNIFSKEHIDDLYIAIGEGLIAKQDVFNACYPNYDDKTKVPRFKSFFKRKIKKINPKNLYHNNEHNIRGLIPGLPVSFAGCCHPVPGDNIVGIVYVGKSITIHNNKCKNLKKIEDKDNFVKLFWEHNSDFSKLYLGRLQIVAENSFGTIAKVTQEIANQNINIVNFKILHNTDSYYELIVDVEVDNLVALMDLKAYLRSVKIIYSVMRV
ncbi:MAG: RelA/SpoT family protein [Rickettsiales bacterium]